MNRPPLIPHPAEALVLAKISASVRERLARIKLMVFDVDGILTDGSLWYGEHGEVFKRFNALDGHGLKMLAASGVTVVLMTGRSGPIVDRRAAELGLGDVLKTPCLTGTNGVHGRRPNRLARHAAHRLCSLRARCTSLCATSCALGGH